MSKNMNRNNHMGIDLGKYMGLATRRDWASTTAEGASATIEQGTIVGYLCSGVQQQRLAPKKGELDLWSVLVEGVNGGVCSLRLDFIIGAFEASPPAPQAQEPLEGEHIPAEPAPAAPRKRTPRKPAAAK